MPLEPVTNICLCKACKQYSSRFLSVRLRHQYRRFGICHSCGRPGFFRAHDLAPRRRVHPFVETWEGWALISHCSPDVWKSAQRAFRDQPYAVQHTFASAPRTEEEFRRRIEFWHNLLLDCCAQQDADAGYQAILRCYDRIRLAGTLSNLIT